MQIAHRTHRTADVLDLVGQFNFGARKDFTAALDKLKQGHSTHILFNVKQVTFVDSAEEAGAALIDRGLWIPTRETLARDEPEG